MHQETIRKIDISISQKYMLSIREARAYFNIGVKKMRRMAEDNEGEFSLFMGNRYLICRPKIEEYIQETIERLLCKYWDLRPSETHYFISEGEEERKL